MFLKAQVPTRSDPGLWPRPGSNSCRERQLASGREGYEKAEDMKDTVSHKSPKVMYVLFASFCLRVREPELEEPKETRFRRLVWMPGASRARPLRRCAPYALSMMTSTLSPRAASHLALQWHRTCRCFLAADGCHLENASSSAP